MTYSCHSAARREQFSTKDAEKLLGNVISFSFVNDTRRVSNAMNAGTCVDPRCELGRQFESFAQRLTGTAPDPGGGAIPEIQKKRFIEYFAVVPSTYHVDSVKRR